jgi:hypothetical protein
MFNSVWFCPVETVFLAASVAIEHVSFDLTFYQTYSKEDLGKKHQITQFRGQ